MVSRHALSRPVSGPSGFSDPRYLTRKFNPGRWLDRKLVTAPSCTAISGRYERHHSVHGGFYTSDVHFFDLSLEGRPMDAKGRLVECFREPQPLGEIIFVPAGYQYIGGGGEGTQRNLFLFLNAGTLKEEDSPIAEAIASPRLQDFMNLRSDRIRFLLARISSELYSPGFASELMIEGLATTLLVETARLLQQQKEALSPQEGLIANGGLAPGNLKRVRERVQDNSEPPSLAELAELCNLSRRHLMRAFRQSTGQTIGQFIQQSILEKAQRLLRNTDKPVGVIATELGFANASAFSTAFRRLSGESPRSFRTREATWSSAIHHD